MIMTMKLHARNLASFPKSNCCLGLTILPVDATAECDSDSDLVRLTVTLQHNLTLGHLFQANNSHFARPHFTE